MPAGLLYSPIAIVPGQSPSSRSRARPAPDHQFPARQSGARVDRILEPRWESMALGVVLRELAEIGLVV